MSKYGAKKVTLDGYTFDSKLEARYYEHLQHQKSKGLIKGFTLQPSFILQPTFKKRGKTYRAITYKADFEVIHLDGSHTIVDVKGMLTTDFKIKRKLFEFVFPDETLHLVTFHKASGGWVDVEDNEKRKKQNKK